MSNKRAYFLDPFGCVKNQVDAENMMAHLNNAGWENVIDAEQANLIIVNSCGFIESAKRESIDAVLGWRSLYPEKKIILAGCLSRRYAKELPEILPEADGITGVEHPAQIIGAAVKVGFGKPALRNVQRLRENCSVEPRKAGAQTRLPPGERPLLSLPGSAYVKISDGCSNCCSYCAIPLIRGALVSRAIPDIIEECGALLNRGVKELCIIGQDVGSFGYDFYEESSLESPYGDAEEKKRGLPELLEAISALEGSFWVRLLYIHPDHFPLQILDIMEKDERFLPYFDIPFQHASQKILAAMNREGSAEKYLALLETIRGRLPHAALRSTFLLGFPGETEEDFAALLDFQEKAKLDWLGCFTYSREEGTAAYIMKERVPAKIAEARKQIIEERQIPITEKNMDRFTGKIFKVLIEEKIDPPPDAKHEDSCPDAAAETLWLGRLYCQAPDIDGAAVVHGGRPAENSEEKNPQPGVFADCKVSARRGFDLEARLLFHKAG